MRDVARTLVRNNYEISFSRGCFDIAARREEIFLLKVLVNIDAFKEDQALSLKVISHFVSAFPLIISLKNNREKLKDETIYSRFGLFVLTPKTFEKIVKEEIKPFYSRKGRMVSKIDIEKMRRKREELNLSFSKLSKLTGISKKALYEIEKGKVNPTVQSVIKLENVLKTNLRLPFQTQPIEKIVLKPKQKFQKFVSKEFSRIGIENSAVYSAPFDLIGKERITIITKLSKNSKKLKKEAKIVKKVSSITSSKPIFVAKICKEKCINGIPVLKEDELSKLNSSEELIRIIEGE